MWYNYPVFLGIVLALALITLVVPPTLPILALVAEIVAQVRLKFAKIYCLNPRNILVCGALDCACFDKVRSCICRCIVSLLGATDLIAHIRTRASSTSTSNLLVDQHSHRVWPRPLRAAARTPRTASGSWSSRAKCWGVYLKPTTPS